MKGFCAVAGIEEISAQGYILTPGRYVGIEEGDEESEPFGEKMMRLSGELGGMFEESRLLEEEIRLRLGELGYAV